MQLSHSLSYKFRASIPLCNFITRVTYRQCRWYVMNECESIFNPRTYIKSQMTMFHVSLLKPPIAGATEKLLYHGTEVPAVCLSSRNTYSCLDRQGKAWTRTHRPELVCRNLLDDNSQEATKLAHQRRSGKFLDIF